MMDLPLHPVLVHLPLGFVFILPILSLIFYVAYKNKWMKKSAFISLTLIHLLLVGFSYFTIETGEEEEERVEKVVSEHYIEAHEEKAEQLFGFSIFVFFIALVLPFLPEEKFFKPAFFVLVLLQFGLIYLAVQAGHSGGELVYKYGAGEAYYKSTKDSAGGNNKEEDEDQDEDEDED